MNTNTNQQSYLSRLGAYEVQALKGGRPVRYQKPATTFRQVEQFVVVLNSLGYTDIFVDDISNGGTYKLKFTSLQKIVFGKKSNA